MFPLLIEKLIHHQDLSADEAGMAMDEIMAGTAAPAHIGALLVGLAMKGERPAEIVGLARTMRRHAVPLSRRYDGVFDCCGTGGDRSATFNISSCVAIVAAACGVATCVPSLMHSKCTRSGASVAPCIRLTTVAFSADALRFVPSGRWLSASVDVGWA